MYEPTRSEARARVGIDKSLESLNWDSNQILYEQESQRLFPKLGNKQPDYVLTKTGTAIPVAVIEAKSSNRDFAVGLCQARDYAEKISPDNIIPIFVSDGSSVIAYYDSTPVLRNGSALQDFLTEEDILLMNKENVVIRGDVVKTQEEIKRIYADAERLLWGGSDGITGIKALGEFCSLLFVKMLDEKGELKGERCWQTLLDASDEELIPHYNDIRKNLLVRYKNIFQGETDIQGYNTIRQLIRVLSRHNFTDTDIDIKGGAYESFLERYFSEVKGRLGQYFTPRHIVRLMYQLLSPRIADTPEKIYDPFCGTGGMLVHCYKEMFKVIKKGDEPLLEDLRKKTLYGNDKSMDVYQLAKMNMVLLGDGNSNIYRKDTLADKKQRDFDVVISNIPFGLGKVDSSLSREYGLDRCKSESVCIAHCMAAANRGGRMAIIVPETIAYLADYEEIRKHIYDNGKLEAVIRLPRAVFTKYATAKTCILYITGIHKEKTTDFAIVDIKNDGLSSDRARRDVPENDIPKLLLDLAFRNYPRAQCDDFPKYAFFKEDTAVTIPVPSKPLSFFVDVKTHKTRLRDDDEYREPAISSNSNTISTRTRKFGKDFA